jgi:FkbM family methyltransferase
LEPYYFAIHEHGDKYVSPFIAQTGSWEPFETKIFNNLIAQYPTFIDLGANIGWYSAIAQRRMPAHGEVYAFEPVARNFELLQRNCRPRGSGPKVVLSRMAVSDRVGELSMHLSDINSGDHRLSKAEEGRVTEKVSVTTLDEFFGKPLRPYLFKCDTQGSEPQILRGGRQVMGANIGQSTLFIEFWPHGIALSGESPSAFAEELGALPLEAFIIDHLRPCLRPVDWASLKERATTGDLKPAGQAFVDLLLLPPNSAAHKATRDFVALE